MDNVFSWLENTWLAEIIRSTAYLYPVLESVHIIGISSSSARPPPSTSDYSASAGRCCG